MPRRRPRYVVPDADGWSTIPPTRLPPRRLGHEQQTFTTKLARLSLDIVNTADLRWSLERMREQVLDEPSLSPVFLALREISDRVKTVRVIGLGRLRLNMSLRQLALIMEVIRALGGLVERVVMRDPVWDEEDLAFLRELVEKEEEDARESKAEWAGKRVWSIACHAEGKFDKNQLTTAERERWEKMQKQAALTETDPNLWEQGEGTDTILFAPHLDFDVLTHVVCKYQDHLVMVVCNDLALSPCNKTGNPAHVVVEDILLGTTWNERKLLNLPRDSAWNCTTIYYRPSPDRGEGGEEAVITATTRAVTLDLAEDMNEQFEWIRASSYEAEQKRKKARENAIEGGQIDNGVTPEAKKNEDFLAKMEKRDKERAEAEAARITADNKVSVADISASSCSPEVKTEPARARDMVTFDPPAV